MMIVRGSKARSRLGRTAIVPVPTSSCSAASVMFRSPDFGKRPIVAVKLYSYVTPIADLRTRRSHRSCCQSARLVQIQIDAQTACVKLTRSFMFDIVVAMRMRSNDALMFPETAENSGEQRRTAENSGEQR